MRRRTRSVHFAVVALGAAALAVVTALAQQRLNVKLGLWEVTTVTQTAGMPPIDTSQLTPEQRARIEAMMSQRQGQAKPETRRECLTQERLDKLLFQDPKDTSCKQTPVSMSAISAEVKIACTGENGMSATGTVHVDAPTPETVKGQATMTSSGGGNTMNVRSSFTARWVAADCGNVK